jgi:hypothetical protein
MREALAKRHPAVSADNPDYPILEAWTVMSEFYEIDLLAISAHKTPRGAQKKADYPWVGYEIKISRGDMRRELLDPGKRRFGVAMCNEFYFAAPQGLLKPEEIAYNEPDWDVAHDFNRVRCTGGCTRAKGFASVSDVEAQPNDYVTRHDDHVWRVCGVCGGRGYERKSRVEIEAPTLWIPKDVGFVEVTADLECVVVKKSPVTPRQEFSPGMVGQLVRWISVRPDHRHAGVATRQ